jgi:hypothetical protein
MTGMHNDRSLFYWDFTICAAYGTFYSWYIIIAPVQPSDSKKNICLKDTSKEYNTQSLLLIDDDILPNKRTIMRNQSLLITVSAVSLLLLMLMPMASAVELKVNASYDGSVGSDSNATWVALRNAGGNSVYELQNNTYSGQTSSVITNANGYYQKHWRGLITWNTAAIPDSATITSAVVSVYGRDKLNDLGTANFAIVDANPSSKSAYVAEDYSRTTFTRMADDILYSSFTDDVWQNFTLNPQGRANISKTGLTTFMFTHSADVDNSPLVWANDSKSAFEIRGLSYLSGSYSPFITINYDIGVTPVLTVAASPTSVTANTPTNVNFTVRNQSSGLVVSGATVALTGVATGTGTTGADGNATISVNAGSAGTITATATLTGYTSGTTTVTANPAGLPVLTVSASPTSVIAGTPTNVNFTVRNATSNALVNGALVTLIGGPATGSNLTGVNGIATISVNAGSAGTITATATLTGYTSGTTTVTANPAPGTLVPDKIGIYQNGVWYLDNSGDGAFGAGDSAYSFGAPGWMNVTGDWNNDGITDIGVTNGQQWYLDWNNNGVYDSGVDKAYNFGAPGWTPIVGDWNNTGNYYIGVTNGQQWYLDWNGNGAFDSGVDKAYNFGAPGWTPIVGDWNATGFTYIGVTNGQQWYLDWNGNGAFDSGVDKAYNFGAPGWITIVGDWNATGFKYIGVTNGQQWYLDWNGNGAFDSGVDKTYNFGAPNWTPVLGKWI